MKVSCILLVALCGSTGVSADPALPQLRRLRITLIPSVREVPALVSVVYQTPGGPVLLKRGAPYSLLVTARGTGNLRGAVWLERNGIQVAKTPLVYDGRTDVYQAGVLLNALSVEAGDYEVKARLGSLDPRSAQAPLHVEVEPFVPASILAEVEWFQVNFDSSSTELGEDALEDIGALAELLEPYVDGIKSMVVLGHTDSRGSELQNVKLALNRATRVMRLLADALPGVPIEVQSLGSANPDPPGKNEDDWAENRWIRVRVESK